MSLVKMIENAELRDGVFIVLDGLDRDPLNGIRVELEPACTSIGGWCCVVRDGAGNEFSFHGNSKLDVVTEAFDLYLDSILVGIEIEREFRLAAVQTR